jgi:hypothetical protein
MACAAACLAIGCGGAAEQPYTTLLTNVAPLFLTVDDTNVMWWNRGGSGDGPVERVPKDDITAARIQVLGPGSQPAGAGGATFTITSDFVSADTTVTLLRYTGPDQVTPIATVPGYGQFVVADADDVYFEGFEFGIEMTTIWAQPVDGSPIRMVTQDAHGQPQFMVIDGGDLYWTADATRSTIADPGVGCYLMKVSTAGGAAQVVRAAPFMIQPFAVDATGVYFFVNDDAQYQPISQTLFSSDRDGGAVVQLASLKRPGFIGTASDIAADGDDLYWTEAFDRLQRMSKTGGAVTTIATAPLLTGVAVDATTLYFSSWANTSHTTSEGALMKMPKTH